MNCSFVYRTEQYCLHHYIIFIQINNKILEKFRFLIYLLIICVLYTKFISHAIACLSHIQGQISRYENIQLRKTNGIISNQIIPKTGSVYVCMQDFLVFLVLNGTSVSYSSLPSFFMNFVLFQKVKFI